MFFMITETKNLQHKSCVEQCGEATRQRKFKTTNYVRQIWQNLVKSLSNEIEGYTKRNSKRIVRMDSPHRGASFLYRTHISTIHSCGNMKSLWGSCLKEGERKLNEDEEKQMLLTWLTTFGSRGPETRVALGIRSIRSFPRGLGRWCFKQRAGHKVALVQESNQRTFGSPRPGSTFCRWWPISIGDRNSLRGNTTRKKATRSAPKLVTRSAWPLRCGYHATSNYLPVAHGWCATGNLLTRSASAHALRVIWSVRRG
jgi:hypothetical protein